MKAELLLDCINDIPERYVQEYFTRKPKLLEQIFSWDSFALHAKGWSVAAACVCLLLVLGIGFAKITAPASGPNDLVLDLKSRDELYTITLEDDLLRKLPEDAEFRLGRAYYGKASSPENPENFKSIYTDWNYKDHVIGVIRCNGRYSSILKGWEEYPKFGPIQYYELGDVEIATSYHSGLGMGGTTYAMIEIDGTAYQFTAGGKNKEAELIEFIQQVLEKV